MNTRRATVWSVAVPFAIVLGFVAADVIQTFVAQGFDVALAPALDPDVAGDGRVPFAVLGPGPFWLYLTGYLISIASLAAMAVLLFVAAVRFSRGQEITAQVVSPVAYATFSLFGWSVGQFVVHMGNNFAANELGVLDRWEGVGTVDEQTLMLWLMFVSVLAFVSVLLGRSLKLQEDQEGLV